MNPRALLHLLSNGAKAIEIVAAARTLGLIEPLDRGWVSLGALAGRELVPGRLYKLLDCLESLGLVERRDAGDELIETLYRAPQPLAAAIDEALAMERDRDRHPWRELEGRIAEVVRGAPGIPPAVFAWPPATDEQLASFEATMAAGCAPIAERFVAMGEALVPPRPYRVLDVGGGDGTLGARLVDENAQLTVDVYNLPAAAPLVAEKRRDRLGFVAGDFLAQELPRGYDAMWFVRVLHDWPASTARMLLTKARRALAPGARIVICEELRDRDRLAVQFFWSHFLIGLDSCVSRLREASFYQQALAQLGFRDIELQRGSFDVITATAQ